MSFLDTSADQPSGDDPVDGTSSGMPTSPGGAPFIDEPLSSPDEPDEGRREVPRGVIALTGLLVLLVAVASSTAVGFRLGQQQDPPAGDLANVERLYDSLLSDAVDSPDPDALLEGAIDGMLTAVEDPFAVYYDPERYLALNTNLDGDFVGVGITLEETPDGVVITGVLPGSPAEDADIMAGERITAVDGVSTVEGQTTTDVIDLVRGEEGDERVLGLDMGDAGPRDVSVTLRQLDLPQVVARTLDSGYGYLRVSQFTRDVAEQMTPEIEAFLEDGVEGLILDLRGNPGGLLQEAVEVVSLFVEDGTVVSVESREGTVDRNTTGDALATDIPLVVLVNGNSASSSEIVAGALQDLDRAEIVGVTTFGKGTVQTIRDLEDGAGVKFTTARYFTPSGDSIQDVGVEPDVTAELAEDAEEDTVLAEGEDVLDELVAES